MLEQIRLRLARSDHHQPWLALLGIGTGLLAGVVIALFRGVVESGQATILPGDNPENYEALGWWWLFLLPTAGGFVIGLIMEALSPGARGVGVVHVLERLAYHQARLPGFNAIVQFITGAISLIAGHSVGREGPVIHLGAAAGSLFGSGLGLPNNSIRTLVACGVAAGIAASFNTPLAGVIFAMEVVLLEYTLAGFIPVILAAVAATAISHVFFGDDVAFHVPDLSLAPLAEWYWVAIMGLCIGLVASLYIWMMAQTTRRSRDWAPTLRLTLGGACVGVVALVFPQVMGVGYDTVNLSMGGDIALWVLLGIAIAKLLATCLGVGLGLPAGVIGPTLVIGACIGAAFGLLGAGHLHGDIAFYAIVGMAAMMSATLQAPLAALTALLELTAQPQIILPGLLAVTTAGLMASVLYARGSSIFLHLLRERGLHYEESPMSQALRHHGVTHIMDRDFIVLPRQLKREDLEEALRRESRWIVCTYRDKPTNLLATVDVVRYLDEHQAPRINLLDVPGQRLKLGRIAAQATIQEAWQTLHHEQVEALYVVRQRRHQSGIYGVITVPDIEAYAVRIKD